MLVKTLSVDKKLDIQCEKRKVSEKIPDGNVVRRINGNLQTTPSVATNATISVESVPAITTKTLKNKQMNARENDLIERDRFSLLNDVLPTDINILDCGLSTSVENGVGVECDINFGISPTLSTRTPKLQLLKPRNTKPGAIENRKCCRPKPIVRANVIMKAASVKPCRNRRLPAKLTDVKMTSTRPVARVILPQIESGPILSKPVIDNTTNMALNASQLSKTMKVNFVNKIVKAETNEEQLSNGPFVDGNPADKIQDSESANLKITMTKVGDGLWEQVKINAKKRRGNQWKMGVILKPKKKQKMEQMDHDYTPNRQIGAKNDKTSVANQTVKTSPPRRRTTPNRLKDCVEVPPSPSTSRSMPALDPPLPSSPINVQTVDSSLTNLTTRKGHRLTSSKKLMKIEAENLLKMSFSTISGENAQMPGCQTQLLPRVLARKGNASICKAKTCEKKEVLKSDISNDLKTNSADVPESIDLPKVATSNLALQTDDGNLPKESPSKGTKVKKSNPNQKKKAQTENIKTSTKAKNSLTLKARQKATKSSAKIAKLTAKAKAIRLQIKAERKKEQTVYKVKKKELSKKKEPALNENSTENTGSSSFTDLKDSLSPEMQSISKADRKKKSMINELKKLAKANANASWSFPALPKRGRGRPRKDEKVIRVRKRSIRFSQNGFRIGRPPKTPDDITDGEIKFLQTTLSSCFASPDSAVVDKAIAAPSQANCLLPKNGSNVTHNTLLPLNGQTSEGSLPGPRAPVPMSSYAFIPQQQSTLATNNPKRSSIRQTECAFRYREIAIKKQDNFIQIVLMSSTRVKNGLNCQAMHELSMALTAAKSDLKCNLVVVNGTGSVFCSGIDLISLSADPTQATAEKMSSAIRDFCKVLIAFPKPLIAAVNGAAVGFGVTFLPFFDLVYASDKATFYTPYCKLGQIPEGGATFTLPSIMGYARANALLLEGRRITAAEAYDNGLVSQVFWPATFMEEVIPRVQAFANRPLQAMESTKALVRYHEQSKLEVTVDTECRVLLQQWSSDEFRAAIREFMSSEEVV